MAMKDLLKGRVRGVLAVLCVFASVAGFVCTENVRAAVKTDSPAEVKGSLRLEALADNAASSFSFINDSLCVISDPANSMSAFIEGLHDLLNGKDTVINIVHLGDSHIQAGFLSGRTMRLLQGAFGNAGRGWIAPFKLSRVNEPSDYFISSGIKDWVAGRCVQASPKCPWGIGGIGISTNAQEVDFKLIIAPNNGAGYSFNRVLMYRDHDAAPMVPTSGSGDSTSVLLWGGQSYENVIVDTFATLSLIDTFAMKSVNKERARVDRNLYFGFSLTNGNPGVLYHAIGVNGAKYKDYTSRSYVRQLSLLNPSLLIVSLGTNESLGQRFSSAEFEAQVSAFIQLVREELPNTTLLMTTPVESYKRIYRNKKRYYERNENMGRIASVISSYAEREGIACWDLYNVAGGDNSSQKWFEAKMLGRDRVHFSHRGYDEQGTLLYKSIIRSYLSSFGTEEGEEAEDVE